MTECSTPGGAGPCEPRRAVHDSPDSTPEIETSEVDFIELDGGLDGLTEVGAVEPSSAGASAWVRADSDPLERQTRQRSWMHGVTLLALAVSAMAVLFAAGPSLGRLLGPSRSVGAARGVARAARSAGWARAPIEPPTAPDASATGSARGALPGFDPLGNSRRGASLADRLGLQGQGAGNGPHAGGDADRDAGGRAPLQLGVMREAAKVLDRPASDGNELGALPEGELVVVASGSGDWVLVAGTTEEQKVVGWTERNKVVFP